MKLMELKTSPTEAGKKLISSITKQMSSWDDLKSNYNDTGFMRFYQSVPLTTKPFTDKDVKKFRKSEGFKHVNTPEELTKVAVGVRKSMIHKMKSDIKKIEALIKPYHGHVDFFDEGDRFTAQIDLGGALLFTPGE